MANLGAHGPKSGSPQAGSEFGEFHPAVLPAGGAEAEPRIGVDLGFALFTEGEKSLVHGPGVADRLPDYCPCPSFGIRRVRGVDHELQFERRLIELTDDVPLDDLGTGIEGVADGIEMRPPGH